MTFTAQDVIDDTEDYIPPSNTLSDTKLLSIAQKLIDKHGDTDGVKPKVECLFLQQVGTVNAVQGSVSSGSVKREKLGSHEIEFFDGSTVNWDDYILKIKRDVCPILGYNTKFVVGAKVNSSPKEPIIKGCGYESY